MKISVIDGYTENPGDLSWDGLRALGDVVIYDHSTKDEAEIIRRVGDAEIVVANKSPRSGCVPEREVYHRAGDGV